MRMLSEAEENRMLDVEIAVVNAKRFVQAANAVLAVAREGKKDISYHCREMATMKRASMDLTMSLPVLRKGILQ